MAGAVTVDVTVDVAGQAVSVTVLGAHAVSITAAVITAPSTRKSRLVTNLLRIVIVFFCLPFSVFYDYHSLPKVLAIFSGRLKL
jgi:predicted MFS family arabinose efflux permease